MILEIVLNGVISTFLFKIYEKLNCTLKLNLKYILHLSPINNTILNFIRLFLLI